MVVKRGWEDGREKRETDDEEMEKQAIGSRMGGAT